MFLEVEDEAQRKGRGLSVCLLSGRKALLLGRLTIRGKDRVLDPQEGVRGQATRSVTGVGFRPRSGGPEAPLWSSSRQRPHGARGHAGRNTSSCGRWLAGIWDLGQGLRGISRCDAFSHVPLLPLESFPLLFPWLMVLILQHEAQTSLPNSLTVLCPHSSVLGRLPQISREPTPASFQASLLTKSCSHSSPTTPYLRSRPTVLSFSRI